MNIFLTAEIEKFISDQVDSGRYHSASEVVREGLRILMQQRSIEELKLTALRDAIKAGLESGPAEQFDMDEILADARAGYQRNV
jgi:antitoxin ParD1/3/4